MAKTLGRFNYLTIRTDKYDVVYKPMFGDIIITIARNLNRDEALGLMSDLNEVIDDFRRMNVEGNDE